MPRGPKLTEEDISKHVLSAAKDSLPEETPFVVSRGIGDLSLGYRDLMFQDGFDKETHMAPISASARVCCAEFLASSPNIDVAINKAILCSGDLETYSEYLPDLPLGLIDYDLAVFFSLNRVQQSVVLYFLIVRLVQIRDMYRIAQFEALPPGFIYSGEGALSFVARTMDDDYRQDLYGPSKEMLQRNMPEVVDRLVEDQEVADLANIGLEVVVIGPGQGKDVKYITDASFGSDKYKGGVMVLVDVSGKFIESTCKGLESDTAEYAHKYGLVTFQHDCMQVDDTAISNMTRDINDGTQTRQRVIYVTGLLGSNLSLDAFIGVCDQMLGNKGGHVLVDLPTFDGTEEDLSEKADIYRHPTNIQLFSENFKKLLISLGVPDEYMQYFDDWVFVRESSYIHNCGRKDHCIGLVEAFCRLPKDVLTYLKGLGFFSGIQAEELSITLGQRLRYKPDSLGEIFAEKGYSVEFQEHEESAGVAMLLVKKQVG